MAEEKEFEKVLLFMGILITAEEKKEQLITLLQNNFGTIDTISNSIDFDFTDYYDEEMGGKPKRFFIIFSNLINPERLSEIKRETDKIEKLFCINDGRTINLDPGILSLHNIILATTKNRSHRIPLSKGIYGETTLIYQNKTFCPLPWTYADYSSKKVISFFCEERRKYKEKIKTM